VTGESWVPLKHLDEEQGKFHIFDSLLSEYAAMGFEYGYSVAHPEALVLWEAQFGDFANGAQTIIDEFITSGEAKWTQKSGVVLLLPHGYEGQGPDHSSARLERFLTLAAEDAFAVAQPSTPASHFHMLRSQALGEVHRPLIVMTPKSMLRNKLAVSYPSEFTQGAWKPVLADPTIEDPSAVRSVVLCSGKVRWDLVNARGPADKVGKTAIVAVERLYPLPAKEIAEELSRFDNVEEVRWVQDEPANQGPWPHVALHFPGNLERDLPLRLVARPESSTTAVGSHNRHVDEQEALMAQAFA
jgi:multifunctional 2-oxoglutarate metabolism enzyme